MEVEISSRKYVLDYRKALFDLESQMLILADLHVGKSAHFRKSGFSMPDYGFQNDLTRLVELMEEYEPRKLMILGDLYHSHMNDEYHKWHGIMDRFKNCAFHLIIGNHDRSSLKNNPFLEEFALHENLQENGVLFSHEPKECLKEINFCGHIHPGVRLTGLGKQSLSLPCFHLSRNQLVFPAFSQLTGLAYVHPKERDKIYACLENKVMQLS